MNLSPGDEVQSVHFDGYGPKRGQILIHTLGSMTMIPCRSSSQTRRIWKSIDFQEKPMASPTDQKQRPRANPTHDPSLEEKKVQRLPAYAEALLGKHLMWWFWQKSALILTRDFGFKFLVSQNTL